MVWSKYDRVYHPKSGITGYIVEIYEKNGVPMARLFIDDCSILGREAHFPELDLRKDNRKRKTGETVDRDASRTDWSLG